jgi:hypothetical protein
LFEIPFAVFLAFLVLPLVRFGSLVLPLVLPLVRGSWFVVRGSWFVLVLPLVLFYSIRFYSILFGSVLPLVRGSAVGSVHSNAKNPIKNLCEPY